MLARNSGYDINGGQGELAYCGWNALFWFLLLKQICLLFALWSEDEDLRGCKHETSLMFVLGFRHSVH